MCNLHTSVPGFAYFSYPPLAATFVSLPFMLILKIAPLGLFRDAGRALRNIVQLVDRAVQQKKFRTNVSFELVRKAADYQSLLGRGLYVQL